MRAVPASLVAAVAGLGLSIAACERSLPSAPQAVRPHESRGIGVHGVGAPGSLVFHSARSGHLDIYVANPDGSDPRNLTQDVADDTWPDISPNGQYVAYASLRAGNREIFVLDLADGTLTNVSNSTGDDNWPRWSPNGHEIAFHSNRDGNYNIYVVNADGSGLRRVTSSTLLDQWPDWSPNGKQIAFRRGNDVWAIDADGEEQNPVRLTNVPTAINQMAAWSPNGRQIAFMSLRDGYCAVFLMSADGETPDNPAVNLTPKTPGDADAAWCSRAPSWSRNGQRIYFQSMRPGSSDADVFVMNADGTGVERLTTTAGEDGGPRLR